MSKKVVFMEKIGCIKGSWLDRKFFRRLYSIMSGRCRVYYYDYRYSVPVKFVDDRTKSAMCHSYPASSTYRKRSGPFLICYQSIGLVFCKRASLVTQHGNRNQRCHCDLVCPISTVVILVMSAFVCINLTRGSRRTIEIRFYSVKRLSVSKGMGKLKNGKQMKKEKVIGGSAKIRPALEHGCGKKMTSTGPKMYSFLAIIGTAYCIWSVVSAFSNLNW